MSYDFLRSCNLTFLRSTHQHWVWELFFNVFLSFIFFLRFQELTLISWNYDFVTVVIKVSLFGYSAYHWTSEEVSTLALYRDTPTKYSCIDSSLQCHCSTWTKYNCMAELSGDNWMGSESPIQPKMWTSASPQWNRVTGEAVKGHGQKSGQRVRASLQFHQNIYEYKNKVR